MNYKNSLNLPKTNFSMKANLSQLEPKMIEFWNGLDIYHRLRKERAGAEKFILHDGPPYANGSIHIGHALNKILKDIIVKYKVLKRYDCPYIIGWDCHGLPVEHQLFKELNLSKHDVEVSDFRKKAKNYALKFVELQKKDFKRLGLISDWDNPYLTLNPQYEHAVISLLGYLADENYIYRGRKPVNWCATCETALAEAEVEYNDKESDSIFVLFKVIDDKGVFNKKDISFLVWTTTPWTLVSNVAVAVHPKLEYNLVELDEKSLVLAKDLLGLVEEKIKAKLKVISSFKGSDFNNIILKHPFFNREAPVVLADFVSSEEGSGCVHIAPGHGQEDFSLTKQYDLDVIMPVNDKGIFDEPAEFKGKNVTQANKLVIDSLKKNNTLINHQKITHSYPHCWRCKEPIIFRATFQWFLNINHEGLREKLIAQTKKVSWYPPAGKERMKAMLVTRPDWCLSRQRLWGVPIPAVKCSGCGEVILDSRVIKKGAEIFKNKGSDSWFSLDVREFLPDGFSCLKCSKSEFEKEYDILDVWFESGASFLAVLKSNPDLSFPADLYLEGSDQHRGWFQVSLIPSVAKEGCSPFKTILTHGFVVDGEGRKMSKSLGNVIAPQEISKRYGAEILRLWAAYTDYSEDVKISEDIIKQLVDMYRKVRNTIRFVMGNISGFNIESCDLTFQDLLEVDKYMAAKLALLCKEVTHCYDEFSFYKATQLIFNFCNLDLSSFYLDILKDRLYTFSPKSKERQSAQFVLYHVLENLLKLIAPILSFTAEEAYQAWENIPNKEDSIFISCLAQNLPKDWLDDNLILRWEKVFSLRDKVLKEIELKRNEGLIGSSLEAEIILKFKDKELEFYKDYQEVLREIFIVSKLLIEEGNFQIKVSKASGDKCLRCWNWSESVGKSSDYPDACSRCIKALKEASS